MQEAKVVRPKKGTERLHMTSRSVKGHVAKDLLSEDPMERAGQLWESHKGAQQVLLQKHWMISRSHTSFFDHAL